MGAGNLEDCERLHEQALGILRELGDTPGTMTCLLHLAGVALLRGDYEGTAALAREALALSVELDGKLATQLSLLDLECVAQGVGDPVRATRLWGPRRPCGTPTACSPRK